jgi:hypothetical protein
MAVSLQPFDGCHYNSLMVVSLQPFDGCVITTVRWLCHYNRLMVVPLQPFSVVETGE